MDLNQLVEIAEDARRRGLDAEQVEHIVERAVDHMERQAPPEAPPTTADTPPHRD